MGGTDTKSRFSVEARGGAVAVTFAEAAADRRLGRIMRDHFSSDKTEGVLVYVPKDAEEAAVDIEIGQVRGEFAGEIAVFADEGSEAEVRETSVFRGSGAGASFSTETEVVLMGGSRMRYVSFRETGGQSASFCNRRAKIFQDAKMTWLEVDLGCRSSRSVTDSLLLAGGACVLHRSALIGGSGQEFDHFSKAVHSASDTSSELLGSHALGGQAKAFCRGLVRVEQGIRGCTGAQKDETILLSDDARMDSAPQLEINSDDVKCSHGSSIGQFDEEKIFYLMSRGLNRAEAEKTALEGFIMPAVRSAAGDVFYPEIADVVKRRIAEMAGVK